MTSILRNFQDLQHNIVLRTGICYYILIIAYKLPTYQLINQMPLREVSGNVLRPQPDVQSRRPGIENQQDTPATRKRPDSRAKNQGIRSSAL